MSAPVAIGLYGAKGRMGQLIAQLLEREYSSRAKAHAYLDRGDSLDSLKDCDVVIDFSTPEASHTLCAHLQKHPSTSSARRPALVSGTTGGGDPLAQTLRTLSASTRVAWEPNFSLGVYAFKQLLAQASPLMRAMGYTPVVVETHHRHKKDAPSGTARSLIEELQKNYGADIQNHSIRAAEVIGDHEIQFHGPFDRITLSHTALDRAIFARGAIEMAIWVANHPSKNGWLTLSEMVSETVKDKQ